MTCTAEAYLALVTDEGAQVRARRERLGMAIRDLATEAEVSRDTLSDMESGAKDFRQATLGKVLRALDRLETEMGIDAPLPEQTQAPAGGIVRYSVQGVYGAEALVVEGPVANIAELEASVDRIMRRIQGRTETAPDSAD